MVVLKTNNIGCRSVDLGFWKFMKRKAADEEITILELQRRIAKANNIQLKEPRFRSKERPGKFKLGM